MTRINAATTVEELGALVCSELAKDGVDVVLSGGAVVSIYSDNDYESADLDFIQTGLVKKTDRAMSALGFSRRGKQRHWVHPDTRYWVEFPPGPVEVGDEVVTDFASRTTTHGLLRLLHPTECVMDRLAAYFYFNDPQGLEQAVEVAARHPVDLLRIEAWGRRGGRFDKHREFTQRLAARRASRR